MNEEYKNFISELYERNSLVLYNIAYSYLKDHENAQDIVEDVFVTALKKANLLYKHENPDGWLYKTLYYKLKEFFRGKVTEISEEQLKAALKDDSVLSDKYNMTDVEGKIIDEICFCEFLQSLPPKERKYIVYRYIFGMRIKEIAGKMGLSQGAVKQLWQRTKKRLKKIFGAP